MLECRLPLRYTMGTMCGFLSRQRCSTDFSFWWRWRGCQLKIFEGWLHRWFQIYTLRIYLLPMGFITMFHHHLGNIFWILSNHQTSKSKRCRNLIQVSVMFWPLFFPKRIMMRLGRWPGMILFSYFQNPTGWGNTMTWLNPCRCWPFLISSTSIRSNGITYGRTSIDQAVIEEHMFSATS